MTPTDPQTPEPTPAVRAALKRAYAAADAAAPSVTPPVGITIGAWVSEHGTLAHRRGMVHASLTAALATECHEAVVPDWADGDEMPCNAYAVAYREDVEGDAVLGVYPVCEEHARPPLVPLTTAILSGVTA